jgi:hypothetical protein
MAKLMRHGASDPRAGELQDEPREGLRPPDPSQPYWRYPSGERLTVRLLLAGQPCERADLIVDAHAEAVRELVEAAGDALVHGEQAEMRRLAAGASRRCEELAGFCGPDAYGPRR